jgi:hypothetical protein
MKRNEFWQRHRGLVWSNPNADDATHIRAALVRPHFTQLLEVALEFGLERVRAEWAYLEEVSTPGVERARPATERILHNLEKGFALASSGN